MAKFINNLRKMYFPHTAMSLPHDTFGSLRMGKLVPVFRFVCYPNDIVDLRDRIYMRTLNPLKFPIFSTIWYHIHYFFVPFRLLEPEAKSFFTGFEENTNPPVEYTKLLTAWDPIREDSGKVKVNEAVEGSLWDYYGFELITDTAGNNNYDKNFLPMEVFKTSYNLVVNEYYLVNSVQPLLDLKKNYMPVSRCWLPDYFTTALPFQQAVAAPSIPLSGVANAVFPDANLSDLVLKGIGANIHAVRTNNTYAYVSPLQINQGNNYTIVDTAPQGGASLKAGSPLYSY